MTSFPGLTVNTIDPEGSIHVFPISADGNLHRAAGQPWTSINKPVRSTLIGRKYYFIYSWAVYCEGPPSFIWGGRGEKNEALLFQTTVDIHFQNAHKTFCRSTVDIHFQNAHKTFFQSTVDIHFQNAHKTQNAKASILCIYYYCMIAR